MSREKRELSGDPRPYIEQLEELLGSYYNQEECRNWIRGASMNNLREIGESLTSLRSELAEAEDEETKKEIKKKWADYISQTEAEVAS